MKSANDNLKVVGGLLLGLGIGTALGIAFTPKSLRRKSLDLTDNLKAEFSDFLRVLRNEAEIEEGEENY